MINTLAIGITNRCPLKCTFCCTPPGPGDFDRVKLKDVVDDAINLNIFNSIGFTGGEPLLVLELLCEMGTYLHSKNMRWGFTTALSVIKNENDIEYYVEKLVSSHVNHITISADESHLINRDPRLIEQFVEAILRYKVFIELSVTRFTNEIDLAIPINIDNFLKYENFDISYHYVNPVGRALEKNDQCSNIIINLKESRCPLMNGLSFTIYPNNIMFPCCSPFIFTKNSGLSLGDIMNSSFSDLVYSFFDDLFYQVIIQKGFSGLISILGDNIDWSEIFKNDTISQCHLCSKISSSPELKEKIRNILEVKIKRDPSFFNAYINSPNSAFQSIHS